MSDAGEKAKALAAAGKVDEAAQQLIAARLFEEAAQLLSDSLGGAAARASQLAPPLRKRAMQAAVLYAKAGKSELAVELFLGLGETGRAAETSGDRARQDHARAVGREPSRRFGGGLCRHRPRKVRALREIRQRRRGRCRLG